MIRVKQAFEDTGAYQERELLSRVRNLMSSENGTVI